LTDWVASGREHRLAVMIAVAGLLVLVLLLVKPSWFPAGQSISDNRADQTKTTAYNLPPKPERGSSAEVETNQAPAPHKTGKHPTPQTKKTPSVKAVSHHRPSLAKGQHMKDGNGLKHGYYVQVGAFKDVAKARKLANSLQHAGWHVQTITKKNALHTVLAGPLPTRIKAENAKLKLAKQSGLKGFIVSVKSGN